MEVPSATEINIQHSNIRIHHEFEDRIENPSRGTPFDIRRLAETIIIFHQCEGRIE